MGKSIKMKLTLAQKERRKFIKTAGVGLAVPSFSLMGQGPTDPTSEDDLHLVGPKQGYTPHIGTMVSMMNWMRSTVMRSVRDLSMEDLDYLFDEDANTIGAMLLHLAATEKYYQINTFEGRSDYNAEERATWGAAMNLGDAGRAEIKGNDLKYYEDILRDVRDKTKSELKKRDDAWLMEEERFFGGQPTNNYCKWWHVAEHESNHNGQIKWLVSRLPK